MDAPPDHGWTAPRTTAAITTAATPTAPATRRLVRPVPNPSYGGGHPATQPSSAVGPPGVEPAEVALPGTGPTDGSPAVEWPAVE